MKAFIAAAVVFLSAAGAVGAGESTPSREGARLYFISPADGESLSGPVTVRFGLEGMGVAPAGVEREGTGHHHLILDAPLPDLEAPIPKDGNYRHFGAGQTEVRLTLPPGPHSLQLLLGDHNHIPHEPALVSSRITITVR